MNVAPQPLKGLRVVEFTHMVMGPTCAMVLADMGAEVGQHHAAGRPHHHVRELDDTQAGQRQRCCGLFAALLLLLHARQL